MPQTCSIWKGKPTSGEAAVCAAAEGTLAAALQHEHSGPGHRAAHLLPSSCHAPKSFPFSRPPCRLYRTLLNFEAYLGCFIANGSAWEPPAGWELYGMLNVTEPASNTEGAPAGATPGTVVLPFAALLLNREEQQLVVAVRGTMTAAEWGIDFSYNQTSDVAALGDKPVHYGFATVFQQLWPGVQAALDELVLGDSPEATEASAGDVRWWEQGWVGMLHLAS